MLTFSVERYILKVGMIKVPPQPQGKIFSFWDSMVLNRILSLKVIFLHWLFPVFCILRSKINQQKVSHSNLCSRDTTRSFFATGINDSGKTHKCVHQRTWSSWLCPWLCHWRAAETDGLSTSSNEQSSLCFVHINRQIVVSTPVCKPLHLLSVRWLLVYKKNPL